MSDIPLNKLVTFMQKELTTRETSYPVRVKMGSLSQQEADATLRFTKAVLQTLKEAEAAGGIAKQALKEMQPQPTISVGRLARFQTAVTEIHRCAKDNSEMCPHCQSIANLLGEMGSVVE